VNQKLGKTIHGFLSDLKVLKPRELERTAEWIDDTPKPEITPPSLSAAFSQLNIEEQTPTAEVLACEIPWTESSFSSVGVAIEKQKGISLVICVIWSCKTIHHFPRTSSSKFQYKLQGGFCLEF
jgi:hypothetical protein